jgi:nucleotide-binding universal stress UspA family protein
MKPAPETDPAEKAALPQRVLVATDGSTASRAAELASIELAASKDASLIIVSVIDPSRLRRPGGLFVARVDQVRAERERDLGRLVEEAREAGVDAQFLIWQGDPGTSVIEAAEAEGADVIVVGSHARGPVGRLLLGSVSSYVVSHAPIPVLVLRPDQRLVDVLPSGGIADSSGPARRSPVRGSA